MFDEEKKHLPCWGLQIDPDKTKRVDSINCLGYKIGLQSIQPHKIPIRRDRLQTLNDFQKLLGDIIEMQSIIGLTTEELSNLFQALQGDKDLNISRK